jgi:protein ImuB
MPEARRYCALFFPILSADRWLREGGDGTHPTVFTEKQRGAMRIVAVDEDALDLGITPGMMLADARARVPDLYAVDYDGPGDAALLAAVADDCDRYTPMVALDPPDGLILDITGCTHLWDGEEGLLSELAARLATRGFTLRLALAETPDKARALARHGGERIAINRRTPPNMLNEERVGYVFEADKFKENPLILSRDRSPERVEGREPVSKDTPGSILRDTISTRSMAPQDRRTFSAPLPIAALELGEERTTALRRAGLYTVNDLAHRPRGPLAARFGLDAVTTLARVLGEEDRHITPRRVPPALFTARRLAEPVAHSDYILSVIGDLAEEARTALLERGEGGRRFTLSLYRSDGDTRRLAIETGAPTRDPALLLRLFRERIDALADPLDPGFGYDAVRFDVAITQPLAAAQIGLDGGVAASEAVAALLDRIGVRLGKERVRRMASGNSHIPERAAFTTPASAPVLPLPWPEVEPGEPPLRPLHLFDPPQRVEVIAEVPDGPPRRFRWRRVMHDVIAHEGPERIAAEWWRRKDGRGLTRDYFRVEDVKGRRFWLFRHGLYGAEKASPDWYLHGMFA